MNELQALKVARRIIVAQDKLLVAYRTGTTRAPSGAIDTLNDLKPKWAEFWNDREQPER